MEYLWVLAPSACVGLLFYFVMKALFNADRKERQALAEAEREAETGTAANRACASTRRARNPVRTCRLLEKGTDLGLK